MPLPPSIRSFLPLAVGLIVGAAGAISFQDSMPGSEGSPQERANRLESELKKAQNRIAELEAGAAPARNRRGLFDRASGTSSGGGSNRRTLADGARSIAENIRDGKPVSPDDIFNAGKPFMRDLAPLVDRMRIRQEQRLIDSMAGQMARKYNLTPEQQSAVKGWFARKSAEEAGRWTEMIGRDDTRLVDVIRASQDVRPDKGIDSFMETILTGEKLASFKSERLDERAQRVQQEADMKVQRLNSIVPLSDTQRDQVFGIMARNSQDYDASMVFDGAGGQINAAPVGDRQAAMLGVLTPDQRVAYDAERSRRREEAAKDVEAIGLSLPPDWEMLDNMDFR